MKPLYNTSIKIFISPLSMLHLQQVVFIFLKKCVFYITYELKLPCHVSFHVYALFYQPVKVNILLSSHVEGPGGGGGD